MSLGHYHDRQRVGTYGQPVDPAKVQEHIHNQLYENVDAAANSIMHLEKNWSKGELVKRVVRYINRSAQSADLPRMEWQALVAALIGGSMQSYTAACGDKPWFYELDLAPSFAAAAWALVKEKPRWQEFQATVVEVFESKIDDVLTTKALWDGVKATFKDPNTQAKVERALSRTYQPSLDECLMDTRPLQDIERVEAFTKRWIENSMQRVWTSLEHPEDVLTRRSVRRLFGQLIAPFGDLDPRSCIPPRLIQEIGRPPREWPFLEDTVANLFEDWEQQARGVTPKRRRTGAAPADEDDTALSAGGSPPVLARRGLAAPSAVARLPLPPMAVKGEVEVKDPDEESEEPPEGDPEGEASSVSSHPSPATEAAEGHPACTSAEDCVGAPDHAIIQHMTATGPGDLYCEACWRSFLDTNHTLEGVYEDTQEVFVA